MRTTRERNSARYVAEMVFAAFVVKNSRNDHDRGFAVVVDVGEEGLRLTTPEPPPFPSDLTVRVALEETIFEIDGTTRWVREVRPGTYDVGIRFSPDDGEKAEMLGWFLASLHDEPRARLSPDDEGE